MYADIQTGKKMSITFPFCFIADGPLLALLPLIMIDAQILPLLPIGLLFALFSLSVPLSLIELSRPTPLSHFNLWQNTIWEIVDNGCKENTHIHAYSCVCKIKIKKNTGNFLGSFNFLPSLCLGHRKTGLGVLTLLVVFAF